MQNFIFCDIICKLIMTQNTGQTIEGPDSSPRRGEIFFHPEELAMKLTETFGGYHLTPARRLAAKLIIEMPADIEEGDRIDYIMSALDNDKTITEAHRDVVVGILEDYKVLQDLFESYIEGIDETTLQGKALRLEDGQQIPGDLGKDNVQSPWSENPPIPAPRIDDLIKAFSTKGEGAQGVGLETAMIVGAVTLAKLKTTPYHDAAVYKQAVFAKNFLIPVCSIIGLDNLESELNDAVDIITGRNIGDAIGGGKLSNNIDSLMNGVDTIASLHFGPKDSDNPERFDFAINNIKEVLSELLGEPDLKPAVETASPHSTLFEVGTVKTSNGTDLEVRARGKGRGSYLKKLLRLMGYYEPHSQPLKNDSEHPIDLYGMTIIAEDDKQMADAYVEAVVKALSSKSITPYPAPGRDKECFVIKGSPEFQENIREKIFKKIPKVYNMELFSFKDSGRDFTDAKITGFYETSDERAQLAPFEVQFSTPDARLVARTGKKAAHFFFKLRKIYGDLVSMSDETADAIIDIWQRKQDYFTEPNDSAEEVHLTNQSRERVACFKGEVLDRRKLLHRRARCVARLALVLYN